MRKPDNRQSSFLFDDSPIEPPAWAEVPSAVFLSWSEARQRAYCAARDRDSALSAVGRGEDPAWFLERANSYV
jgi:hypothetical protein